MHAPNQHEESAEVRRSSILVALLAAVATLFSLEATRVQLSTANFLSIDDRFDIAIVASALIAFPAIALGGILVWRTGL